MAYLVDDQERFVDENMLHEKGDDGIQLSPLEYSQDAHSEFNDSVHSLELADVLDAPESTTDNSRTKSSNNYSTSVVQINEDQLQAVASRFGRGGGLHSTTSTPEPSELSVRRSQANHVLTSVAEGDSEVEQLVDSILTRFEQRIPVTKNVRRRILFTCRQIEKESGLMSRKIMLSDLLAFRSRIKEEVDNQDSKRWFFYITGTHLYKEFLFNWLGVSHESEEMLRVLDKAVDVTTHFTATHSNEYFYYEDFVFDYTRVQSRWPWLRPGLHRPLMGIFLYYAMTPLWFCVLSDDKSVCDHEPEEWSPGWMSTLYFASTTLSTVGYGDLTVSDKSDWHLLAGIIYMVFSNFVLIVAFSSAVEQTFSSLKKFHNRFIRRIVKPQADDEFLHKKLHRLRLTMLAQFSLQFFLMNLIGVIALRLHVLIDANERSGVKRNGEHEWNLMTTTYWAVQTTTTIGYGDLTVGADFRWFQFVYLIISTYFVGNALTGFATMRSQIDEVRRRTAWSSREVNKAMIHEMQGNNHDDKIDQFEFTIASLLQLGKISLDQDIRPIMDRYRELCNDEGFISFDQDELEERREVVHQYHDNSSSVVDFDFSMNALSDNLLFVPFTRRTGGYAAEHDYLTN